MPPCVDQLKAASECRGQTACVVAADGKAAASFRAVKREGTDDGMSARAQGAPKPSYIGRLILRVGEKVKRRPVVPDIVGSRWLPNGHVGRNPRHLVCVVAHARPRGGKRRSRQIQHRDILKTLRYQAIGKP